MALKRVYGPYTILGLKWDMIYDLNFAGHSVFMLRMELILQARELQAFWAEGRSCA